MDDQITRAEFDQMASDIASIKAMMMEVLEFKGEIETALADFQPPNIMKMVSGMFGGGNGRGAGMDLPQLPPR